MKKNTLLVAILATLPMGLFASSVTPTTTITKMYVYKTAAVIKVKNKADNEGCGYSRSGEFIAIRFGETGSKELYSAVLSAYVSGAKVQIGTSGCDNIWSGDGTMNKAYRITLVK